MSQKQKVIIGGVVGVAFIIAFGLFLSDVEVEYDLSNVDFVICDTSIGTVDIFAYGDVDTGSNTSYSDVSTGSNDTYSDVATGSNTSYSDAA